MNDKILHKFDQTDINLDEFIREFETLDPNKDIMTVVSPTFFYSTTKALINRIRELEEINESHKEFISELEIQLSNTDKLKEE